MQNILIAFFLTISLVMGQASEKTTNPFVNIEVLQPKDDYIHKFWTKKRMESAAEYKPPAAVVTPKSAQVKPLLQASPVIMPPSVTWNQNSGASYPNSNANVSTTGRAFWQCPNGAAHYCSAGIIYSISGSVIATAGHCVFDTSTLSWVVGCNWMFAPGYINGITPYGVWTVKNAWTFQRWANRYPDFNFDVGFVILNTLQNQTISQAVGYQPIGFNMPYGQSTIDFGYPYNIGGGQQVQYCNGTPSSYNINVNYVAYRGQGLSNCGMGAGCSGGPWFQAYNPQINVGISYSLNSFTIGAYPNTIFGPMFDSNVLSLWQTVTNK